MSEGKRPGGLTAMAVINFVFGGFSALGVLGMVAMVALVGASEASEASDEKTREIAEAWQDMGVGYFYAMLAMMVVSAVLLIASGVGYLKQKRFLGRTLGNVWACLSIVGSLWSTSMVKVEAGGGFTIGTIVGLIYPLLTLVLLNGTFKEDLVR